MRVLLKGGAARRTPAGTPRSVPPAPLTRASATTQRMGIHMPLARCPGMWHSTVQADGSGVALALGSGWLAGTSVGTTQRRSTRWPDATTTRTPPTSGATLTTGVGPGGAPSSGASAASQASCTAPSPMTTSWTSSPPLTMWSITVSPGTRSQDRWHERVVLGDEVDVAGRVGRAPDRDRRHRDGLRIAGGQQQRQEQDERAGEARGTGHARSLRRALDAVPGTRRRFP